MDVKKVLLEFVITFVLVYLTYYLLVIRKCRKNKGLVPTEITLILSFYEIDIEKIDLNKMIKVVSFVTTCILSIIITSIGIFFDSTIIVLVFGTAMSILVAIICYRIIGSYYEKQSKKSKKTKKGSK